MSGEDRSSRKSNSNRELKDDNDDKRNDKREKLNAAFGGFNEETKP